MPVKQAKTAGFCMGVRRAMNAVLEATQKSDKPIYTLGPLVHNRQAIEMLEAKKVKVVKSKEEADSGILFIRAHGVTPEVKEGLKQPGLEIKDMTCPHVRRAQKIIERHCDKGYHALIIGDEGHAEVVGLLGHARGRGFVVATAGDLKSLPDDLDRVCVVAQTTQNRARFDEIIPLIEQRYPGAEIHDTVCSATDDRQAEVRTLAREVDAIVVVGGKHSANTVRLAEIARAEGMPTFHVETAAELDVEEIRAFHTIGITGGASTPHWVFRAVVDKTTRCLQPQTFWIQVPKVLLTVGVYSYFYIGAGSAAMTYAACRLLQVPPRLSYLLVSFLYVVAMCLFNRFTDQEAARLNDPHRMEFLSRFQLPFVITAAVFSASTLGLAWSFGVYPFVLMFLSLLAGIGYSYQWIPSWLARKVRFKAVKEIPGSKDTFVSLAWATVTVLLPFLAEKDAEALPALCLFFFFFVMVFVRSLAYDMKDLEGDRIMGKETFPLIMGRKAALRLIGLCLICLLVVAVLDLFFSWSAAGGFLLLPVVGYVAFYLFLFTRRLLAQAIVFELVVDAQFIITGLAAWIFTRTLG